MPEAGQPPKRELPDAVSAYLSQEAPRPARTSGSADSTAVAGPPNQSLASPSEAVMASRPSRRVATPLAAAEEPSGKQQLAQAYDRLLEYEATKPKTIWIARPEQWRQYVYPTVIAVGLAVMVYIWIGRPAWLFPRFAPNPDQGTAHPEHRLIAVDVLIRQFQAQRGRIPQSMDDLGLPLSGVSMVPLGTGGYQLVTRVGDRAIVLNHQPGANANLREVK
jgi:hypothetical protein